MNGSHYTGTRRTAGRAYGEGAEFYHESTEYTNQLVMGGNVWTTLCPAPSVSFPSEIITARKGWGCVIFDTYVDKDWESASNALALVSGSCTISNVQWLSNPYGEYGIGFDFDKTGTGSVTVKVHADKCLHDCSNTGMGRELDGDRIDENGDDYEWEF